MKRKLPPLNTLVTFEAASRLQSFKEAGEELNITSSAVSHQIRKLETWLGLKLFERSTRSIDLTDTGRRLFYETSEMLEQLEKITQNEIARFKNNTEITLQTTDTIAARWLIPRLSSFHQSHPKITVKVITYEYLEPFRPHEADIGILLGKVGLQQANATLLFEETIFPVCRPGLIKKQSWLQNSCFNTATLIHDDNLGVTWDEWFHAAISEIGKYPDPISQDGPHFNHSHLAINAAEQGNGIVLAAKPLVVDAILANRLDAPFQTTISSEFSYYLVSLKNLVKTPQCEILCNWLQAQSSVENEQ